MDYKNYCGISLHMSKGVDEASLATEAPNPRLFSLPGRGQKVRRR